jgi:prophage regulatory protein
MMEQLRVLRLPEVKARVGLGESAIYQQVKAGTFPKSIPLGAQARGWLETEINDWISERAAQRGVS